MLYHDQSDDYRPLFWVQGRPVYANTLIVSGHVLSFVICALCIWQVGQASVIYSLGLSTPEVWHGQVWRLFSYVACDQSFFSSQPYWFLISLLMLYFFGREVEQFIGRRAYLLFYAALIVVPAILLSLVGLFTVPALYLNCGDVIFGVFVAFAVIYPGSTPLMWVPVSARVVMWVLLAVYSLLYLSVHAYTSMFMLWACAGVAFVAMRIVGTGSGMNWLTDWLERRRTERLARMHNFKVVEDRKATESIDAILDKISKQGVGSLNASERAHLEKARAKLIKRDQS